ncbi:MAG: hypothetical protein ACRDAX_02560 [Propionibacteriaceae bacterium]
MAAHNQQQLDAEDRRILESASRKEVANALSGISIPETAEWLDPRNVYSNMAQDRIKDDGKVIPAATQGDFAKYLAASSFIHCGDAWGYLGRAVDALMRGDIHGAVHLTYYAELRGAISLLASEGIYIGNGVNFVLTDGGTFDLMTRDSTHIAAWKYLSAWNDQTRSKSLIAKILRPGGTALDDWMQNMPASGVNLAVSGLLARMSFDLQSFANDRSRRNTASYTPTRLVVKDLSVEKTASMVSKLWQVLEPDSRGTFPILDQLLLKDVLKASYAPTHQEADDSGELMDKIDWSDWEDWLQQVAPASISGTALFEELLSMPNQPVLSALFDANNDSISPVEFIEAMFSRTSVLLRIATGSCVHLFEESGLKKEGIAPWVQSLGVVRGLWEADYPPENMLDLWSGVAAALETLDPDYASPHALLSAVGAQLLTFGQTERVVAWSFA